MPKGDSISAVLERLGNSLLAHEAGPAGETHVFEHVTVLSPIDDVPIPTGALVLGVGVQGAHGIAELLGRIGAAGASALVVRAPAEIDSDVHALATKESISVLSLVGGASWLHLATLLRPQSADGEDRWTAVGTADAELDLFKIANSLSGLLDAPVTIEDRGSRILAFSADQARADEARKASVLGQQVPNVYQTSLTSLGIFRKVYTSARPLFIEPFVPGAQPRVACRVAAGDELLGSIWAVAEEPLSAVHEEAMMAAANVAAIAMLRSRIAADAAHRIRLATVAALLEGGHPAWQAAQKLCSPRAVAGGYVLAAGLPSEGRAPSSPTATAGLDHVANSLMMLLRGELPSTICALLGETIYGVVPTYADETVDLSAIRRLTSGFVQRLGRDWRRLVIGIGAPVDRLADLNRSRDDADLVLRVLRSSAGTSTGAGTGTGTPQLRVATREDVYARSLLLRLSDLLAGDVPGYAGPLDRLRDYDQTHDSALLQTLRCWLDNFGDISAASERLHIHKNTLRYRLKRIAEVTRADLNDAETRFGLMLQFRLEY
ncbi:helix-turn-helix domain-containing protein [Streptomyces malaysiensis subsp. malaysiensis]|uniref:Helix-turn-helix domain-containing protein n=1 Tax=Streptomyces malaysiensis TaxID=92644 RepID=A0ABX6WM32_STRMQ|nr:MULTISPECIES: helix-turn-helix domain-containing protein [Streptomyces]QPI61061.1 helix-turn-helix domain-containing protein [Streptomyces solisilvae]UHH22816.1 helix-turn-helix domain-containing protein [Streptomyces sp. HNM0561]